MIIVIIIRRKCWECFEQFKNVICVNSCIYIIKHFSMNHFFHYFNEFLSLALCCSIVGGAGELGTAQKIASTGENVIDSTRIRYDFIRKQPNREFLLIWIIPHENTNSSLLGIDIGCGTVALSFFFRNVLMTQNSINFFSNRPAAVKTTKINSDVTNVKKTSGTVTNPIPAAGTM